MIDPLIELYKEIKQYSSLPYGYNIFNDSNITDEKINIYIVEFYKHFIPESFSKGIVEEVYINKDFEYGVKDQYKYIVNNKDYYVNIFYYNVSVVLELIDKIIYELLSTQEDTTELEKFREYLLNNPNKYVLYISFNDILGQMVQTGDMKEYATQVIGGLVRACRQSIHQKFENRIIKTCALYFNIYKTELKRSKLYYKIIVTEWPFFKNMVEETKTNNKINYIFYYK